MKIIDTGLRRDRLLVIDLNNFIFRSYHAFPMKRNKNGDPINALNGFFKLYKKLLLKTGPTHIVVCKDVSKYNYRYDLFPQYKANRSKSDEELSSQIKEVWKLLDALNISSWGFKGFEADDLIGAITTQWVIEFDQIYIASTDKDLAQLINPKVKMYNPVKDQLIGHKELYRQFGLQPHQIVDFLALLGDTADNVPGVKGIGEKTAISLLREFSSVEELYNNLDKIEKPKVFNALKDNKENAILSKELVVIPTHMKIPLKAEDTILKPYNIPEIFYEKELYSAIKSIKDINSWLGQ